MTKEELKEYEEKYKVLKTKIEDNYEEHYIRYVYDDISDLGYIGFLMDDELESYHLLELEEELKGILDFLVDGDYEELSIKFLYLRKIVNSKLIDNKSLDRKYLQNIYSGRNWHDNKEDDSDIIGKIKISIDSDKQEPFLKDLNYMLIDNGYLNDSIGLTTLFNKGVEEKIKWEGSLISFCEFFTQLKNEHIIPVIEYRNLQKTLIRTFTINDKEINKDSLRSNMSAVNGKESYREDNDMKKLVLSVIDKHLLK